MRARGRVADAAPGDPMPRNRRRARAVARARSAAGSSRRGRARRSTRLRPCSRGSRPARKNDDLPTPDGPRITNRLSTPVARMPRSASRPRRIWASRPKNTAASASSIDCHPRYGVRFGSCSGGHGKYSAPIPASRRPRSSRASPSALKTTGSPSSDATVISSPWPSVNRSQICHSRTRSPLASGLIRAQKTRLFRDSASRASATHSPDSSQ